MAFLGERGPEQSHDAVPECPDDRALEPLDRLAHRQYGGTQLLHCLFRIEAGDELSRADDIGKEHRGLLALAPDGKHPRRLRAARRRLRIERTAARATKPGSWRIEMPAFRAEDHEPRAAILAIAVLGGVFRAAGRAAHRIDIPREAAILPGNPGESKGFGLGPAGSFAHAFADRDGRSLQSIICPATACRS